MGYGDKFYRRHLEYRDLEMKLSSAALAYFDAKSAIDFGCGIGSFLESGLDRGLTKLKGYELHFERSKKYTPERVLPYIEQGDVTQPLADCGYDLAMSVEVAEHIRPEGSEQFVKNMVQASTNHIMLTAAPPGQRGTGHINLKPSEYWVDLFQQQEGCSYSPEGTKDLKKIWTDLESPLYLINNLLVFKKY